VFSQGANAWTARPVRSHRWTIPTSASCRYWPAGWTQQPVPLHAILHDVGCKPGHARLARRPRQLPCSMVA